MKMPLKLLLISIVALVQVNASQDTKAIEQALATCQEHISRGKPVTLDDLAIIEALIELVAESDEPEMRDRLNRVFDNLYVRGMLETNALTVDTSAAIGGNLIVAGTITSGGGGETVGPVTATELILQANSTSNAVIVLPASETEAYNFQLPPNGGSDSYVLTTDGSGATSWQHVTVVGATGITQLNTLTTSTQFFVNEYAGIQPEFNSLNNTHTLNIPLASSYGVLAGLITSTDYSHFQSAYTAAVVNATTAGTAGTLVLRNGSGDITFGTSNPVTLAAPASGGAQIITLPAGAGSNGYILVTNGAGVTSWQVLGATVGVGNITGDSGSAVSGAIFLTAGSTAGKTVAFDGITSTTLILKFSDANNNIALGNSAGGSITSGAQNTLVGSGAGALLTTGTGNTLVGYGAGPKVTGPSNVLIGAGAGSGMTTGAANVIIGVGASPSLATGSNNVVIGAAAGLAITGNNSVIIGNAPFGSGVNEVVSIGSVSASSCYITGIYGVATSGGSPAPVYMGNNGSLGTVTTSSKKFKDKIQDMGSISESILELRPVSFVYKNAPDVPEIGLIAEEANEVLPFIVQYDKKTGEPCGVAYHRIPMLLLNEVQKLYAQVQDLQAQLCALRNSCFSERTVCYE